MLRQRLQITIDYLLDYLHEQMSNSNQQEFKLF